MRPGVDVSVIERVTIGTYAAGIAFCDQPHPATPHEARFSFQHIVAIALLRGAPGLADCTTEAIADSQVAALRARIAVSEDPALTAAFPARMGATVGIVRADGTSLSRTAEHAPGDPEMPMPEDAVRDKFHANLDAAGIGRDAAKGLVRSIAALHDAPSLADLTCSLDALIPRNPEEFIP